MKNYFTHLKKLSAVIITVMFCMSMFAVTAFAEEVTENANTSGECAQNVGDNGESCVVSPRIVKPDLLPGPNPNDSTVDVTEKYFLTDLLPTLIRGALNLLGAIAVIMIMIGGIMYLTAYGDDTRMETAKNTILYAVIGLFIAMFSYTIVSIVSDAPLSNVSEISEGVEDGVTSQ